MSHSISRSADREAAREDRHRNRNRNGHCRRNRDRTDRAESASEPDADPRSGTSGKNSGVAQSADNHRENVFGGWRRYLSLDILKVIAGILLLVALSWEIIAGDHRHFSPLYLWIQFIVCVVFLCDFFIRLFLADHRGRFFWEHLPYLFLSIPWLNLVELAGIPLSRDWGMLVGLIPMLRAFLAMNIIVQWIVNRKNRVACLFWAYIFTVVVFTYLSALVFYDYEQGVNTHLHGFGNALWWAWMNVTTVGAEIFAVTAIGKVVTVLLPSMGMLFFPIFTTYILDRFTGKKGQV